MNSWRLPAKNKEKFFGSSGRNSSFNINLMKLSVRMSGTKCSLSRSNKMKTFVLPLIMCFLVSGCVSVTFTNLAKVSGYETEIDSIQQSYVKWMAGATHWLTCQTTGISMPFRRQLLSVMKNYLNSMSTCGPLIARAVHAFRFRRCSRFAIIEDWNCSSFHARFKISSRRTRLSEKSPPYSSPRTYIPAERFEDAIGSSWENLLERRTTAT